MRASVGIIFLLLGIILSTHPINGQSVVQVQLVVRKYVEKGESVTMHCEHNVRMEVLYKVSWFKNDLGKFYEFVNGRIPPFRNFSISGAEIDFPNSNEEQVTLKNLDFDAAGHYYCEVSTNTPIYTKDSQEEQLHVILPQTGPPRISFSKRHFFVGEKLVANCTTSKARPAPHITWLINGKKVDEKYVRALHPYAASGKNSHRSKSHQQQQQYQQQSPNSPSMDLLDSSKGLRSSSSSRKDEVGYGHGYSGQYENHHHDSVFSPFSPAEPSYESNHKHFDNKYLEGRKHRNAFTREYRRYVSDASNNMGSGGFGSASITSNSGSSSPGIPSLNNGQAGSSNGGGAGIRAHRPIVSSSQLSIQVSELHVGNNGRLEITCLATIPAHVGVGEQFADYKTYSVKIDIEKPESSSIMPPMSGMAALGNSSSAHRILTWLSTLCLPTALFLLLLNQF